MSISIPDPSAPAISTPGTPLRPLGPEADLLAEPGCPACRYAVAAGGDYLTRLAGEGAEDAGLCTRHSRRSDKAPSLAGCPACEHEDIAARAVIRILLEVVTPGDRKGYKQHGGLCLPHLRHAVLAHRKTDTSWLVRFMLARLAAPSADLNLLAGWSAPHTVPSSRLATAAAAVRQPPPLPAVTFWSADCLCRDHLRAAVAADETGAVLARQARLQAQRLAQVLAGSPRQRLGNFLPVRARKALEEPACPVCRAREAVAQPEAS